jgi:hypothetical protein
VPTEEAKVGSERGEIRVLGAGAGAGAGAGLRERDMAYTSESICVVASRFSTVLHCRTEGVFQLRDNTPLICTHMVEL